MHLNTKIIRINNIRLRFGAIILHNKKIQSITKLTTNAETKSIFLIFLLNISHCIHLRRHVSLLKYSIIHLCAFWKYMKYILLTKQRYSYYRMTIIFVSNDFKS